VVHSASTNLVTGPIKAQLTYYWALIGPDIDFVKDNITLNFRVGEIFTPPTQHCSPVNSFIDAIFSLKISLPIITKLNHGSTHKKSCSAFKPNYNRDNPKLTFHIFLNPDAVGAGGGVLEKDSFSFHRVSKKVESAFKKYCFLFSFQGLLQISKGILWTPCTLLFW